MGRHLPDMYKVPLPAGTPDSCLGLVLERSRQLCLQTYEKVLLPPLVS